MKGKKLIILVAAIALLVAIPAVVFAGHGGDVKAVAVLHVENASGVTGTITFTQRGEGKGVTVK